MDKNKPPKRSTTVFLIFSTMLLCLALFGCGIYSLYISIGFRFLNRSAVAGLNTASLYTYPNSSFGTGSGTMMGLILVSIIMVALGIAMAIIFFKQLPLYKQIKFISKMPNVKYREYSKQAKKSVIVWSIIAYIVSIAFSVFALIVVYRSGVSANYLWILATLYFIVLGLSIASMVLMFVKIAQLSKIRKFLLENEKNENNLDINANDKNKNDDNLKDKQRIQEETKPEITTTKSFGGGNTDFLSQDSSWDQKKVQKIEDEQSINDNGIAKLEKNSIEISQSDGTLAKVAQGEKMLQDLNSGAIDDRQVSLVGQGTSSFSNLEQPKQTDSNILQNAESTQPSIVVNIPEQSKDQERSIGERLFTDGIFELGDQLVKLREMHVSGLISNEEYTMLREKWIDAVMSEPLFGKKRTKNKNRATPKSLDQRDVKNKIDVDL